MSDATKSLVPAAATELVSRILVEAEFLFKPRYTEYLENKKEQTNPYAGIPAQEQVEVIVEGLLMFLAQVAASAPGGVHGSPQDAIANMSKRLRAHVDFYHRVMLEKEESRDENANKGT